jgi:hypothetical protein
VVNLLQAPRLSAGDIVPTWRQATSTMTSPITPSTSTFSFTAPFPLTASSSSTSTSLKQQRRVSLALPSSPRQFPAWSFRDDTSVGVGATPPPTLKKGKIRRIASDHDEREDTPVGFSNTGPSGDTAFASQSSTTAVEPSKKQRKKWTLEETQMLVDGCNKVRRYIMYVSFF